MTPAPVVAARNTNTAVEGRIIMTDEELQQTIQALSESIDELSDPEKPLTKQEQRRKQVLSLRKDILQKIKEAREKNEHQELSYTISYGLLTALGEKHPLIMHLIKGKFVMDV